MDNFSEAKRVFNHYMRKAWEASGLRWDSDNEVEVNGIIDDLVNGIREELHMEKEKVDGFWADYEKHGANEGYQPMFYGRNAQIRKELPEKFMEEVDRYDRENNFPAYEEMER